MIADDLTRRAIIAAHAASCARRCGHDATAFRTLTPGEAAVVELWRQDREELENECHRWRDQARDMEAERDHWERAATIGGAAQ